MYLERLHVIGQLVRVLEIPWYERYNLLDANTSQFVTCRYPRTPAQKGEWRNLYTPIDLREFIGKDKFDVVVRKACSFKQERYRGSINRDVNYAWDALLDELEIGLHQLKDMLEKLGHNVEDLRIPSTFIRCRGSDRGEYKIITVEGGCISLPDDRKEELRTPLCELRIFSKI